MSNIIRLKITAQFAEPLLGTASANPEVHREYIAAKAGLAAKEDEEVTALLDEAEKKAVLEGKVEKATTIFPKQDGKPFLWDYQIRGFFKENIRFLIELGDKELLGGLNIFNHKTAVDSMLFVFPRRILLVDEHGQPARLKSFTRPLRADTMQGPRVCLATSEEAPAGTRIHFEIHAFQAGAAKAKWTVKRELLEAALEHGCYKGIGQWRSGGNGRFTWSETKA